jgi:hypothetical protein
MSNISQGEHNDGEKSSESENKVVAMKVTEYQERPKIIKSGRNHRKLHQSGRGEVSPEGEEMLAFWEAPA